MSLSERLPRSWLVQASTYNVKIGEETVITTVTDREAIVISSISALKSELKTPDPFVGIDNVNNGDLLLFHVKNRCLIIQFNRMMKLDNLTDIPLSLKEFLRDKSITFIGPRNISQNSTESYISVSNSDKLVLNRVVHVGYLTGKLCKKPNLQSSTLEELLGEVVVDIKKPIINEGSMRPNWQSSSILSEEEVKLAVYEVYSCYQIASKLITDATSATVPRA
uniref:3'-5' exonuclease domain-containing protein n=1 Tax=Solanum tuberosum TaxID=4113 RepID=M1BNE4_SOLTU